MEQVIDILRECGVVQRMSEERALQMQSAAEEGPKTISGDSEMAQACRRARRRMEHGQLQAGTARWMHIERAVPASFLGAVGELLLWVGKTWDHRVRMR